MTSEQQAEQIPAAHITEFLSHSVSTDGSTAMLVFRIADGSKFAITVPTVALGRMLTLVQKTRDAAQRQNLGVGMQRPQTFAVGHSDQMRGMVAITFDEKTADEATFILADQSGLDLAGAIERNVFMRMPMEDRRRHLTRRSPIIPPRGGKLILPGR